MKGIRQALGLGKKNSTTSNGTGSPSKRDSKTNQEAQSPISPSAATSGKKIKADKKRNGKGKKFDLEADAAMHQKSSLPGIGPLRPFDPQTETAAPPSIVGAESITEDAIRFIKFCCDYFLKYGPAEKGIFRISGDTSLVLRLKQQVNLEPGSADWGIPVARAYVHEISSLFKLFFREMPIPLLTYDLYTSFVSAFSISEDIRVEVTKKLLDMLPPKNKEALGILCRFLQQMSEYSDATLMDIKNLSVVFSPNILRPRVETPETLICDARAVYGTIADFMINNATYFPLEGDAAASKGDDKSVDTENVAPAAAAAPTEVKPILFTASPTTEAASTPATSTTSAESVVQQMDEQYTRMRRMSQRAITTLRKTKKLNDEELEATMLSISERIKEGDIVVATSLIASSPSNDRITFSIGDSSSDQTPGEMVRSPSQEAAGPPPGAVRSHRAQALSHLPPMVRTGSSDGSDGSLSPPSASGAAVAVRRGNRKRDAPFALKDDELKNLQAEIEGAKDDALPAALSAPTKGDSPTAPRRKSTRRGSHRHSEKSSKKHRSSTRKSKSKRHTSKSSKHDEASETTPETATSSTSSSSSTAKRSREYHRSSKDRRDSNDKTSSTAASTHITVVTFKEEPKNDPTDAEIKTETPSVAENVESVVEDPAKDDSAPVTPTASGRSSRAASDAVRDVTSSDSANSSGAVPQQTTMASPRSDTSGGDQSDLDDDDDDDDQEADPLREIQNELLSALLGEAVADSSEEEEDNETSQPTKEGDDDDEASADDHAGEGSADEDDDEDS
eukprot:TRINITY_DN6056_c0_g1_i1.p1 TRINITY_DN6056_c0_g1~~TRINITY_DN6056_c0_g1_i1.p1  ORF type:complete len:791 (-),score=188.64 TRINITY_DN6056_c0_g1_i1:108-2480(-)